MKKPKELERLFKGAANHRRIAILMTVDQNEGIVLEELAAELGANLKTVSQHTCSLVHAGLLHKKYHARQVTHFLSPYGKAFLKFMGSF